MSNKADLNAQDIVELIGRLENEQLQKDDYPTITAMIRNGMPPLAVLLRKERPRDDRTKDERAEHDGDGKANDETDEEPKKKEKQKGHGRLGSADYPGAHNQRVPHESLHIGDKCPCCDRGHLYKLEAKELINLIASAPIDAIRYLLEHLRCSSCQKTFTAKPPEDVRPGKSQPSANAAVVLMKYALGVPFKRLETWQQCFGVPLPDATQFEMSETVANCMHPIFLRLEALAADSELIHLDDTGMPILSLIKENKGLQKGARYGMNTTGILAYWKEHPIHLYYVGRNHAGENLEYLLENRSDGLQTLMQMGDGSSCNTKHSHVTHVAFCNSHAVRKFKDARESFDWECNYILDLYEVVFKNDAKTKTLTKQARLSYHQKHSAPLMDQLFIFMTLLMKNKGVEPSSTLGAAIKYTLKRWTGFTYFLRIPGAPLDNNIIERALKLMIRLRKNAFFFKNDCGAWIGSQLVSILATTTAAGANPMDYLQAVQIHRIDVSNNPGLWLPWNYRDRVSQLNAA